MFKPIECRAEIICDINSPDMQSSQSQLATVEDRHGLSVKLMQFLAVPTFVLDGSGNVLIWNRACERLTGVTAKEVIGTKSHWKGFYDQPRACLADLIFEGRVTELEALYTTHDEPDGLAMGLHAENWCRMPRRGEEHYLAIDAGPIYDEQGKLIAVVETLRDITLERRHQQALEHLASRDGLTGVLNRRQLEKEMDVAWHEAQERQSPLSILLLDIDWFKQLNDTLGHQAGDDCLREISKIAGAQLHRSQDHLGRYGGEEFMVILPHTDLVGAIAVSERIRHAINACQLPHPVSPLGCITVSFGVACLVPSAGQSVAELVRLADQSLYQAKQRGRDRTAAIQVTPCNLA